MKHLIKRYSWLLLPIALPVVAILLMILLFDVPKPAIDIKPNNIYEETLIINAAKDWGPYSFIDDDGNPSGHDVELIYILADELEMNVDLRFLEWEKATSSMEKGEADVLLGLIYMATPLNNVQPSIPLVSDTFIAFGTKDYNGLHDLYSKKISILTGGNIVSLFLEPYQLMDNTTTYDTYEAAFDAVASGESDYVISTYSVGRLYSASYDTISAYGAPLVSNSFHLGITADNNELVKQINALIIEKNNDGTLKELSDKWLGSYIEIISFSDFMQVNRMFFTGIMGITILIPLLFLLYSYKTRLHLSKTNEAFLFERASRDALTGLFNRSACERAIKYVIDESKSEHAHALFMIDVDYFKSINDTHGHIFGDNVLILVAKELKIIFRNNDIVARLGGDEFLVFMKNFTSLDILHEKATALCKKLNVSRVVEGRDLRIAISVGIAICPTDGTDFASLYRNADSALYAAKQNGKNTFAVFNDNTFAQAPSGDPQPTKRPYKKEKTG